MTQEDVRIILDRDRRVRVLTQHSGSGEAAFSLPLGWLERAARTLERGAGDRDLLVALGASLHGLLLPPSLRHLIARARERCVSPDDHVRIRFVCRDPVLAALPLEALYDPQSRRWPATDPGFVVSRLPELPDAPAPRVHGDLSMLVVAASPSDRPPLDWQAEVGAIEDALAPHLRAGRARIAVLSGTAARPERVAEALASDPRTILHLVGHGVAPAGDGDGGMYWEDSAGRSAWIPASRVAALCGGATRPRLVYLSACHGAEYIHISTDLSPEGWWLRTRGRGLAGALLGAAVQAVLAMQGRVRDEHAVLHARAFYQGIADGLGVELAAQRARTALHAHLLAREPASLAFAAPVLLLSSARGDRFELGPREVG